MWRWSLVAVVGMLVAVSTPAQDAHAEPGGSDGGRATGKVCAPGPSLSAFQREVREAIRTRRQFGFRDGRRYVGRLQRERRGRRVAFTPRERAYLRLRGRLTRAVPVVTAYLGGQPDDLSGGVSIEDAPGRPHVVVRVTRDAAAHETGLRERFPHPGHLEVVEVARSERELRDLAESVAADSATLAEVGMRLSATGPDIEANTVDVEVITRRHDAADYFRDRYGEAVVARVVARRATRLECVSPDSYRVTGGGRTLRLAWMTGPSRLVRIRVSERPRAVRIGIVQRVDNGAIRLIGIQRRASVRLRRPLGDRPVIGATTRRPVR